MNGTFLRGLQNIDMNFYSFALHHSTTPAIFPACYTVFFSLFIDISVHELYIPECCHIVVVRGGVLYGVTYILWFIWEKRRMGVYSAHKLWMLLLLLFFFFIIILRYCNLWWQKNKKNDKFTSILLNKK